MIAPAGYAAAREGAIVIERADRAQLRVRGRDPVRMLHGLLTNDLAAATPDRAVYGAMLTPKGRMIADARALVEADGAVLLDFDTAAGEALAAHLRKMVPPLFAKAEPVEPPLRTLGVYGPHAAAVVREVTGLDVADDTAEYDVTRDGDLVAIATRETGLPGFDLLVAEREDGAAAALRSRLLEAGARPAADATFETLRIEAGRPRWGAELTEERIPLEAGLLERAISTSKGCYTGQEVIIRILHRGHVNWQLRGLTFGQIDAPEPGTELVAEEGGKVVARVTSAVASPSLGEAVGLAYVRREVEPGAELRLPDGARARVAELPMRRAD